KPASSVNEIGKFPHSLVHVLLVHHRSPSGTDILRTHFQIFCSVQAFMIDAEITCDSFCIATEWQVCTSALVEGAHNWRAQSGEATYLTEQSIKLLNYLATSVMWQECPSEGRYCNKIRCF